MIFRNSEFDNDYAVISDDFLGEYKVGQTDKGLLVTPVSPLVFVTTGHTDLEVVRRSTIHYQGEWYGIESVQMSEKTDAAYVVVSGACKEWNVCWAGRNLSLKNSAGESANRVEIIGKGCGRGNPIKASSGGLPAETDVVVGWEVDSTYLIRRCINIVEKYDEKSSSTFRKSFTCRFNVGTGDDAHMTPGDSGGPCWFLFPDGSREFAGVVSSDGGQPATFGKIGTVGALIIDDLGLIAALSGSQYLSPPPGNSYPPSYPPYSSNLPTTTPPQMRMVIQMRIGNEWVNQSTFYPQP